MRGRLKKPFEVTFVQKLAHIEGRQITSAKTMMAWISRVLCGQGLAVGMLGVWASCSICNPPGALTTSNPGPVGNKCSPLTFSAMDPWQRLKVTSEPLREPHLSEA